MVRASVDIPRAAFPANQRQPVEAAAGAEEQNHVSRLEQGGMATAPARHPEQRPVPHQIADGLDVHSAHRSNMRAMHLKG
jgi:hypothetical protein